MRAHQTTAAAIKKLTHTRVQKIDIYDDRMMDTLDDLASKWAVRVELLNQKHRARKLSVQSRLQNGI